MPGLDHFEAAAFEHGGHQVLADIMQIAFDRADFQLRPGETVNGEEELLRLVKRKFKGK